ncbi:hypothetical protein K2X33_16730 [bacterium]|nr:hypothetical protein [bacterium]
MHRLSALLLFTWGLSAFGAVDKAQATAWRDELIPQIESLLQKKFATVPEVEITTLQQAKLLFREQFQRISGSGKVVEDHSQIPEALGYCNPHDGKVYLFSDRIDDWLPPEYRNRPLDFYEMILAHELTHALQLGWLSRGVLAGIPDRNQLRRLIDGATSEGLAYAVVQRLAEARKLPRCSILYPEFPIEWEHRDMNSQIRGAGTYFIRRLLDKSPALAWKALENLPTNLTVLKNPGDWATKAESQLNVIEMVDWLLPFVPDELYARHEKRPATALEKKEAPGVKTVNSTVFYEREMGYPRLALSVFLFASEAEARHSIPSLLGSRRTCLEVLAEGPYTNKRGLRIWQRGNRLLTAHADFPVPEGWNAQVEGLWRFYPGN